MRARPGDRGFSLTELMVVVAIVGVMSAVAVPYFGRDRLAREGGEFASQLARDLQRSRSQAVTDRLPVRAFFFSDRVEFRSAIAGATPGAAPRAPTVADPLLRVNLAKPGVSIFNVLPSSAAPPAAPVLNTAVAVLVEFDIVGQAQLIGQPPLTGAYVYVRNTNLVAGHPSREYRIDIIPLTGYVSLKERW